MEIEEEEEKKEEEKKEEEKKLEKEIREEKEKKEEKEVKKEELKKEEESEEEENEIEEKNKEKEEAKNEEKEEKKEEEKQEEEKYNIIQNEEENEKNEDNEIDNIAEEIEEEEKKSENIGKEDIIIKEDEKGEKTLKTEDSETNSIEIIGKKESDAKDEECSNEQILNNECKEGKITNEQITDCYNQFKEDYLTKDYKGENKIIQTENAVFQLTKLDYQKDDTNPDISSIDLCECESILKEKYNISKEESLIILKTDLKNNDLTSTYVQYEIYHPYSLIKLNMDYCKNVSIIVNTPVCLDEDTLTLYDSLSKSGYNLFDANDSFYTDICTTYTSENGTDVILKDRQNEIYSSNANISLCQSSCTFESYNITTKKAKCNCDIQNITTETNINNIKFGSNLLVNSFLITFKYSNIIVLKCFKLAIDLTSLSKNIGRIIMIIIFFLFFICIFIFLIKDKKNIENFINLILHCMRNIKKNSFIGKEKNKMKNNGNLENKKSKNQKSKDKKENNFKKKPIRKKISKKGKRNEPPKRKIYKNKKQLKAKKDDNKSMINSKNELLNKSKRNYKGININIIPIKNIIKYKIKKNTKKN